MTDRSSESLKVPRTDRTISAILLASVFVFANVAALYFLGHSYWTSFPMPVNHFGGMVHFQNEMIGHCATFDGRSLLTSKIDILTGKTRFEETGVSRPWGLVATKDGRLWNMSNNVIVETEGSTERRYTPKRICTSPISRMFLYENCPAIVDIDDSGVKYRLYVFQDGEWQDRGEVGIPGTGRKWVKNESTGMEVMQTCAACTQGIAAASFYLEVIEASGDYHLFFHDIERRLNPKDDRIILYRKGFDFIPQVLSQASAMIPENVPADSIGWTLLDLKFGLSGSAVDEDQIVFVCHQNPTDAIRFSELSNIGLGPRVNTTAELVAPRRWQNLDFVEAPDGDGLYFIRYRPVLPKFYQYKNREIREIPPPWDTDLSRIVRWAVPVACRLCAIFVIGTLILIGTADWLCLKRDDRYGFGATTLRLSPIWRRYLARAIDLSLILAVAGFHAIRLGPYQIATEAYEFWDALQPGFNENSLNSQGASHFFESVNGRSLGQAATWAVAVVVVLIFTQAYFGVTPGKWICRLRILRTTLRPCGFARSLLRELALVVDAALLLTPLPAIISMLTTENRQRIGDVLADTVVVDASGLTLTEKKT